MAKISINVTFGFKVIKPLSQDIFSKINSITPRGANLLADVCGYVPNN